jgi:hypothetical protein
MARQTFQFLSLAWNENMNWLYFGIAILLDFWKMVFVTNHTGISLEYDCITRLVLRAGKYIAKDHYTTV